MLWVLAAALAVKVHQSSHKLNGKPGCELAVPTRQIQFLVFFPFAHIENTTLKLLMCDCALLLKSPGKVEMLLRRGTTWRIFWHFTNTRAVKTRANVGKQHAVIWLRGCNNSLFPELLLLLVPGVVFFEAKLAFFPNFFFSNYVIRLLSTLDAGFFTFSFFPVVKCEMLTYLLLLHGSIYRYKHIYLFCLCMVRSDSNWCLRKWKWCQSIQISH